MKGRVIPIYRPGVNRTGEIAIPAHDLVAADGHTWHYVGRTEPKPVGGGVYITLSHWSTADGLVLAASLDPLPHQSVSSKPRFLHCSVSRADRYPEWDEMTAAVEALAGPNVDMAMIKPRRSDYISLHTYCFHFWELPVEWGLW